MTCLVCRVYFCTFTQKFLAHILYIPQEGGQLSLGCKTRMDNLQKRTQRCSLCKIFVKRYLLCVSVSLYLGCVACTLLTPQELKWQLEKCCDVSNKNQHKNSTKPEKYVSLGIWSVTNITHPCAHQDPIKFNKLICFLWKYRAANAYLIAFSDNISQF